MHASIFCLRVPQTKLAEDDGEEGIKRKYFCSILSEKILLAYNTCSIPLLPQQASICTTTTTSTCLILSSLNLSYHGSLPLISCFSRLPPNLYHIFVRFHVEASWNCFWYLYHYICIVSLVSGDSSCGTQNHVLYHPHIFLLWWYWQSTLSSKRLDNKVSFCTTLRWCVCGF